MPDLIKLKDKRLPFHLFLSQFLEHNSEEKVKLTVKDKLGIDVDYEVDLKEFIDTKQTAIDSDLDSHKHVSAIAKQNGEDGKAVATFFEFPLILTSLVLAIVFPTPLVFVALTAMILLADVAKVLYDQTNSYSRHVSRMEKAISEAKKGNINRYTKGRVGSFIPLYTKFTYYCASTTDLFGFLFRNRDKRTTLTWNDSGGFQVNSKEESRVRFPKFITKKNFEKLYNKACYEGLEKRLSERFKADPSNFKQVSPKGKREFVEPKVSSMCIETIGGIGVDESLKSFFKKEACARAWFEDLSISQETLSKLPWSILLEQNSSKLSKRRTSQLLAHRSNSIKV